MSGPVPVVLADDEQRRLDDEPEIAVFKGAAVPLAHQESDESGIALPHLVRCLVEGDARTVHDGKIGGEDAVECNEAVVEDRSRVLR